MPQTAPKRILGMFTPNNLTKIQPVPFYSISWPVRVYVLPACKIYTRPL